MLMNVGSLGGDTYVAALNDRGAVVGISRNGSRENRAFLYENNRIKDLGTLGGPWARAEDINDQGVIVGSSVADATGGPEQTFIYERGRMRALFSHPDGSRPTAINNRGEVIGYIGGEGGLPFLYKGGQLVMLEELPEVVAAGWTDLVVEDINDRGWITGYGRRNGGVQSFVLKPR